MKLCGAKVWIYLTGFDMGDLTWMRHCWTPLVYKLKHDFENLDFWGKDDFFFFLFKMDEAWLNAHTLEMDAWFLEIWIFIFIFEKMMMMVSFFLKWMRHGRMPLVCKLIHDFWKPWYLRKIWFLFFFFFFKMDEAWPNALSLEMDAWFLEILISFSFSFFQNEWGMAECP